MNLEIKTVSYTEITLIESSEFFEELIDVINICKDTAENYDAISNMQSEILSEFLSEFNKKPWLSGPGGGPAARKSLIYKGFI